MFDVMATALGWPASGPPTPTSPAAWCPSSAGPPGDPQRAVFAEGGYDPHEGHAFEGRPQSGALFRTPEHIYYPKGRLQQDVPLSVCRSAMVRTMTHRLVRARWGCPSCTTSARTPGAAQRLQLLAARARAAELESRLLDWYVHTADVVPPDEHPRGVPSNPDPTRGRSGAASALACSDRTPPYAGATLVVLRTRRDA